MVRSITKKDYKPGFSPQRKKPKLASIVKRSTIKPSLTGMTESTSANIKVAVRLRPLNEREEEMNNRIVVKPVDSRMLIFDPKEESEPFFYKGVQQQTHNYIKRANKEMQFMFDHVFQSSASNYDVFSESTKDLIGSLMDGYNCSVFAYGATGAGKTHTMLGSQENPGITYLTMQELFSCIATHREDREFDICVSYLEIYNENVHDLLKPSGSLNLLDDGKFGVRVAGLHSQTIGTAQELLLMLEQGSQNRTQHPTDANAESSRSHAVFQVYIKMRTKSSGQVKIVKLSMIDLAGSERASATGCTGDRFKEGANINRSLLALGNCINQLADGSKFIPYRDSKLTRLLKDSLGGNCRTVMIANLAPTSSSYEDTYNTLKYATRANKIQLRMKKNIVTVDNHVSQYIKRNEELSLKNKQLEALLLQMREDAGKAANSSDVMRVDPKKEQRKRLLQEAVSCHCALLQDLLGSRAQQRKLLARAQHKRRALKAVAALIHQTTETTIKQDFTNHVMRLEMSLNTFLRQVDELSKPIILLTEQTKNSEDKLKAMMDEAVEEIPKLKNYIVQLQNQMRIAELKVKEHHLETLNITQHSELNHVYDLFNTSFKVLHKYFLCLQGQGRMTKQHIEEYNGVILQAKNSKAVTWEDENHDSNTDDEFKHILNLDCESSSEMRKLCDVDVQSILEKFNNSPSVGLPMQAQPASVTFEDLTVSSEEEDAMNATRTVEDHKAFVLFPKENFSKLNNLPAVNAINVNNLNSTFVLAQKTEGEPAGKKPCVQSNKVLFERTNLSEGKMSGTRFPGINKPAVVGNKRPATLLASNTGPATPQVLGSKENKSGFGSTASRFHYSATPSVQVGCKIVRGKERAALKVAGAPYSRSKTVTTSSRQRAQAITNNS